MTRFFELCLSGLREPALYMLLLQAVSGWLSTFALQWWWVQRLDPERRARAWNALTWATATFWFGPLGMLPLAWVTRRPRGDDAAARAIGMGLLGLALALILQIALGALISYLFTGTLDLELS